MKLKRILGDVLVVVAMVAVASCALFAPGKPARKVVDCTVQAVADAVLPNLGRVNEILANTDTDDAFASGRLRAVAADVGLDVVACILRDQGPKFAESASANPDDLKSAVASRRAGAFLEAERIEFSDVPK